MYTYESDERRIDKPIVVLTNGNTASAAELFTAALKDYDMCSTVGETSYGKGVMANHIPPFRRQRAADYYTLLQPAFFRQL